MWSAFSNLWSRTWSNLLSALSTSTLSVVIFSFALPVVGFFATFVPRLLQQRNTGASVMVMLKASILSWPTLVCTVLTLATWITLIVWFFMKTVLRDQITLYAAPSKGVPVVPPPMPLARTAASQRWLYTPLKEVYRRDYHDEEVVLDGFNFIDCSFGRNVVFRFDGLAPFKMINPKPKPDFVMAIKTENLIIQHFLNFLRDTNTVGGVIEHHPPAN